MRRTSTDRAKAALGYIVAGLKQEKGTYRFLHYDESGHQSARAGSQTWLTPQPIIDALGGWRYYRKVG